MLALPKLLLSVPHLERDQVGGPWHYFAELHSGPWRCSPLDDFSSGWLLLEFAEPWSAFSPLYILYIVLLFKTFLFFHVLPRLKSISAAAFSCLTVWASQHMQFPQVPSEPCSLIDQRVSGLHGQWVSCDAFMCFHHFHLVSWPLPPRKHQTGIQWTIISYTFCIICTFFPISFDEQIQGFQLRHLGNSWGGWSLAGLAFQGTAREPFLEICRPNVGWFSTKTSGFNSINMVDLRDKIGVQPTSMGIQPTSSGTQNRDLKKDMDLT